MYNKSILIKPNLYTMLFKRAGETYSHIYVLTEKNYEHIKKYNQLLIDKNPEIETYKHEIMALKLTTDPGNLLYINENRKIMFSRIFYNTNANFIQCVVAENLEISDIRHDNIFKFDNKNMHLNEKLTEKMKRTLDLLMEKLNLIKSPIYEYYSIKGWDLLKNETLNNLKTIEDLIKEKNHKDIDSLNFIRNSVESTENFNNKLNLKNLKNHENLKDNMDKSFKKETLIKSLIEDIKTFINFNETKINELVNNITKFKKSEKLENLIKLANNLKNTVTSEKDQFYVNYKCSINEIILGAVINSVYFYQSSLLLENFLSPRDDFISKLSFSRKLSNLIYYNLSIDINMKLTKEFKLDTNKEEYEQLTTEYFNSKKINVESQEIQLANQFRKFETQLEDLNINFTKFDIEVETAEIYRFFDKNLHESKEMLMELIFKPNEDFDFEEDDSVLIS